MTTYDAIVIGGGIIGLSLARELSKHGKVLVVERAEPGHEASYAAAGMLACCDPHTPQALRAMAKASAKLWPEFVRELRDESQLGIDYRENGTLLFQEQAAETPDGPRLDREEVERLEPELAGEGDAYLLAEASVDPRQVCAALLRSLKHRGVDLVSGTVVEEVLTRDGQVTGVRTIRSQYASAMVINCAGAWTSQIAPGIVPTRPIKGQMLSLTPKHGTHFSLRHVVRSPLAYLVPRSDGRMVIGTTVEDVGYDKRVETDVIQRLHQQAAILLPELGEARIAEAWAGLRPATPDKLPLVGETAVKGYFANAGHYRDGILLAPASAVAVAALVAGEAPPMELREFDPRRFAAKPL